MKKLAVTLTLTLACVAAFAQGKVNFKNDTLHLVYFTSDTSKLLAGDSALAGTAVSTATPSGVTLAADLWAGTASDSLSKQFTSSFGSGTPGTWAPISTTAMPSCPAGTDYFQVQVYDQSAGSYAAAVAAGKYAGESYIFTSIANSTTAYFSIVQNTTPASSTWLPGTFALDSIAPGAKGSIEITATVPEPTSLALLGLGAAGLMIFRRRK